MRILAEKQKRIEVIEFCIDSIINNLSEVIYGVDYNGFVIKCNESQAKFLGFEKADDVIGRTIYSIGEFAGWSKKATEEIRKNDLDVILNNKPKNIEEIVEFNKKETICLSFKNPLLDSSGEIIGTFGMTLDTSNTKKLKSFLPFNLFLDKTIQANLNKNAKSSYKLENVLTSRECDCAFLLLRGKTAKQIAKELGISPRTVETHLDNMKSKLGCLSKAELIETIFNKLDLAIRG